MVRPHVHEDGWLGVETTQLSIENQLEESICVSSLCSWVQNLFLASHLHIVKPSKRPRESCSHGGSLSLRFGLFGSPASIRCSVFRTHFLPLFPHCVCS